MDEAIDRVRQAVERMRGEITHTEQYADDRLNGWDHGIEWSIRVIEAALDGSEGPADPWFMEPLQR